MRLLQSCNFKELADEGLDELLDNLPSTPQKWESTAHAVRDTKSMSLIIQLNPDDPPPPLPRHKKLRKANTTRVEASDLVRLYISVSQLVLAFANELNEAGCTYSYASYCKTFVLYFLFLFFIKKCKVMQ